MRPFIHNFFFLTSYLLSRTFNHTRIWIMHFKERNKKILILTLKNITIYRNMFSKTYIFLFIYIFFYNFCYIFGCMYLNSIILFVSLYTQNIKNYIISKYYFNNNPQFYKMSKCIVIFFYFQEIFFFSFSNSFEFYFKNEVKITQIFLIPFLISI